KISAIPVSSWYLSCRRLINQSIQALLRCRIISIIEFVHFESSLKISNLHLCLGYLCVISFPHYLRCDNRNEQAQNEYHHNYFQKSKTWILNYFSFICHIHYSPFDVMPFAYFTI